MAKFSFYRNLRTNVFKRSKLITVLKSLLKYCILCLCKCFPISAGTCVFTATVFDFINTTDCNLYLSYTCFTYGGELLHKKYLQNMLKPYLIMETSKK